MNRNECGVKVQKETLKLSGGTTYNPVALPLAPSTTTTLEHIDSVEWGQRANSYLKKGNSLISPLDFTVAVHTMRGLLNFAIKRHTIMKWMSDGIGAVGYVWSHRKSGDKSVMDDRWHTGFVCAGLPVSDSIVCVKWLQILKAVSANGYQLQFINGVGTCKGWWCRSESI